MSIDVIDAGQYVKVGEGVEGISSDDEWVLVILIGKIFTMIWCAGNIQTVTYWVRDLASVSRLYRDLGHQRKYLSRDYTRVTKQDIRDTTRDKRERYD